MKGSGATIYGLVLAGGYSRRMGQDKATLKVGDRTLLESVYQQLDAVTERTFISCRREQVHLFDCWPVLPDDYLAMGPIAGLASAMDLYPEAAWLVHAVDLRTRGQALLHLLLDGRNVVKDATIFSVGKQIQPLFAIYEPSAHEIVRHQIAAGTFAMMALVERLEAEIIQGEGDALINLNAPEDLDLIV